MKKKIVEDKKLGSCKTAGFIIPNFVKMGDMEVLCGWPISNSRGEDGFVLFHFPLTIAMLKYLLVVLTDLGNFNLPNF